MLRKSQKNSKTEKAQRYFTQIDLDNNENPRKKTHKCNIPNCEKYLNGENPSNLVTHLRYCHKQIYEEIIGPEKSAAYYLKKSLKFIQNCAELVAINGRPFSSLQDSGFRKFVDNDFNELKEAGYAVDLRDKLEIKKYITELANKIKSTIKIESKERFVSLMVDIGSKNSRSFLGISVQYLINGLICVRCLGTIQLKHSHTAVYVKEVITDCLLLFDISVDQIASITTDNGANMLAMIDLFNSDDGIDDNGHNELIDGNDEESGRDNITQVTHVSGEQLSADFVSLN